MIPVDFCQKNEDLNEIMRKEWLQTLVEYRDELDTTYSDDFYLWTQWFFKY